MANNAERSCHPAAQLNFRMQTGFPDDLAFDWIFTHNYYPDISPSWLVFLVSLSFFFFFMFRFLNHCVF